MHPCVRTQMDENTVFVVVFHPYAHSPRRMEWIELINFVVICIQHFKITLNWIRNGLENKRCVVLCLNLKQSMME